MEKDPKASRPLVDTHAHILLRDMPRGKGTSSHSIPEDFPAERYLQALDEAGVQYGIAVASSQVGPYYDYQIRMLRKYDRLRATVILPTDTDFYTFEQLDRDGVVGVRLAFRTISELPDFESIEYRRFFHRLRDFDWHAHVHMEADRLPAIVPALKAAGVKVVIDHFGRLDPKGGLENPGFTALLRALENDKTWVKLSAPYRLKATPELVGSYARTLLEKAGPEKLLWGSDWPFTGGFESSFTIRQAVSWLEEWVSDEKDRHQIHTVNTRQLLNLER